MRSSTKAFWLGIWAVLLATPVAAQDSIRLRNGEILEGRIIDEDDKYVTIKSAEARFELRLPKSRIMEINRAVRPTPEPEEPGDVVPQSDEWFLIRDANGNTVGSARRIVRTETQKGRAFLRIEEQWSFVESERKVNVSIIEKGLPTMNPVSFHYREWSDDEGFVLQGDVQNSRLKLSTTNRAGVVENDEIPFPAGTSFPLLARMRLRQDKYTDQRRISISLFDYHQRALVMTDFLVGESREINPGRVVRVLGRERHGVVSEEWVDPKGKTVRLEVNGPYLVAERTTVDKAQAWLDGEGASTATPTFVEGGRRAFRVHIPNPTWRVIRSRPQESSVLLRRDQGDINAALLLLDEIGDDLTLEGMMLALERRVVSLSSYRRKGSPRARNIGSHKAVEMAFEYRIPSGLRGGRLFVLSEAGRILGCVISGEEPMLRGLQQDLNRLIARLEIFP